MCAKNAPQENNADHSVLNGENFNDVDELGIGRSEDLIVARPREISDSKRMEHGSEPIVSTSEQIRPTSEKYSSGSECEVDSGADSAKDLDYSPKASLKVSKRSYLFNRRRHAVPKQRSRLRDNRLQLALREDNPFLERRPCCREK